MWICCLNCLKNILQRFMKSDDTAELHFEYYLFVLLLMMMNIEAMSLLISMSV